MTSKGGEGAAGARGDDSGCGPGLERRVSGRGAAEEELAALLPSEQRAHGIRRLRCCRRRASPLKLEEGSPSRRPQPDVTRPWRAPNDPLRAEWEVVARGVSEQEYSRLQGFRRLVEARGLDSHKACAETPHTRRAVTLLRFLRARQGNSEQACGLLSEALDWRRDFEIDRRMREWKAELRQGTSARLRVLMRYKWTCVCKDAFGLPVFIHRESVCDAGGLLRELGSDFLLVHAVTEVEDAFEVAREQMLRTGVLRTSFVEIYDVGNYGLVPNYWQRGWDGVPFFKSIVPVIEKVYPERVRLAFVIRMPRSFWLILKLFWPLVPPETKKKIKMHGFPARAFREELIEAIGESNVPPFMLTDDMQVIAKAQPQGGLVPRGALAREEALAANGRPAIAL